MKKLFTLIIPVFCWLNTHAQVSHNMDLIYHWTDTNIVPITSLPALEDFRYNDVWGYAQEGREYAIIGSTMGVHFFDITDTANISQVDFIPGNAAPITHREFNSYRNYLYIVGDQGVSGLMVADMQYLPDSVHLVYNDDTLIRRSHELHIDTAMQKLYLFGVNSDLLTPGVPTGFAAMILDISQPDTPQYLSFFIHPIIDYVHDGYVRNDTAFFHSAFDGLYYGYFGDPQNPVEIDVMPFYLDQGYNHSGWLTDDGRHYVMMDETQGMRIKMIDMQPGLNFFTVCGLFEGGNGPNNMAHNPHIRGNFLYASYYQDGVRIFDITDRCNPTEVAWYDTWPGDALEDEFRGAWGVYAFLPSGKVLVSDIESGLYVLQPHLNYAGVNENAHMNFTMHPNPASDWVQFSEEFSTIRIYDVNGKILRSAQHQNTISVEGLSNGIYMVGVEKNGNWNYTKMVKE